MDLGLTGKTVLVTGGALGIGRAIVRELSAEGCTVVVADIDRSAGSKLVEEIGVRNGLFVEMDVTDTAAITAAADTIAERYGTLDVLVNNAGIWRPGSVEQLEEERWDAVLDVNLKGYFVVAKAMIPLMTKGGAIINMASVAGLVGSREASAYNASKGGVINLTRGMALDLAPKNIRVNCITPGLIDTAQGVEVVGYYTAGNDPKVAGKQWHPLGRVGVPEDITPFVALLASDKGAFATGATFTNASPSSRIASLNSLPRMTTAFSRRVGSSVAAAPALV